MLNRPGLSFVTICAVLALALPVMAQDQGSFGKVIRIPREAFSPDAGLITFSEKSMNSKNPFYRPADYGAGADGVQVTFGGFFLGQSLARAGQCPPGASRTGCLTGNPTAPLRLSGSAPTTFITSDRANPTSPSLSGSPRFDGPVSILFDKDIAGVGLAGGFFNAERSTAIQAYDRMGKLIGGVKNITTGMEYMALVTEDGRNRIAGLQFSLVGAEPHGYAIDELSFAFAGQLDSDQLGRISDALRPKPEVAGAAGEKNDAAPAPREKPTGSLGALFGSPDDGDAPARAPGPKPKGSLGDLFAD